MHTYIIFKSQCTLLSFIFIMKYYTSSLWQLPYGEVSIKLTLKLHPWDYRSDEQRPTNGFCQMTVGLQGGLWLVKRYPLTLISVFLTGSATSDIK